MLRLNIDQRARQKALDERREINPHVIAKETGMPYATVYSYWHGDTLSVQIEKLGIFSRYFNCSIDELFIEDDTEKEIAAPIF